MTFHGFRGEEEKIWEGRDQCQEPSGEDKSNGLVGLVRSLPGSISKPVRGAVHRERPGDRPVPLHRQGQDHVVGGAQGEGLQELENLAENQSSNPLSTQDLPDKLTCNNSDFLSVLTIWLRRSD